MRWPRVPDDFCNPGGIMTSRCAACRLLGTGIVFAAVVFAGEGGRVSAQQPAGQPAVAAQSRAGGAAASLFALLDANKDGALTRDEMKAGFDAWYTQWDASKTDAIGQEQVFRGLNAAIPPPPPAAAPPQNQVPRPEDVTATLAALPEKAPATPRKPRKVLVLGKAAGFVHTSIPIAARSIEEMGKKLGAWSTTITYDPADINEANLKQYDAIFLASTTGAFLDDPKDPAATAARRKALLDFVRGGKGIAGIHAACDSYHQNSAQASGGGVNWGLLPVVSRIMMGDTNADARLSRAEVAALADGWYDKLDAAKAGRVAQAEFPERFAALPSPPPPARPARGNGQGPATDLTPDKQVGTWAEFNTMMGAFFKWHWNDGQPITVKLDDPGHPVNAPFKGQSWDIVDEIYTFSRNTYSRANLRVLTSVDYAKMSAEDKAKENNPRTDGDYALSWVRREGKGRVFYEALGHNEKVYAHTLLLEHVLAGMQYVLGDLDAVDAPSSGGTK
jgi:type 1 glutamine amidotransferase